MNAPDILHVTFDQNPAVKEAIEKMAIGDKTTFDIHVTLKSQDPEGADFTIEAVVPDGYEISKEGDEGPTATEPAVTSSDAMMTPMAMAVRKRKAK